jgi:hypothetical protein
LPPVQWHSAMQLERYQIEMLVGYHWLTCCCHFDEQCILLHFVILCDIPTLIVPYSSCSHISIFFAKGSYFNLNAKPANPSLALHHNLMDLPPTCINSSRQHLISLPAFPASKQELLSYGKREVPWL